MSRIGKQPIPLPSGVEVKLDAGEVKVKGPKGQLAQRIPDVIQMDVADGEVRFTRPDDRKPSRALHGLARALVANMVTGVTDGFARDLSIVGVGYRAEVSGKTLKLSVGFSNPVDMPIPEGLKVSVDKNTELKIEGIDKQAVGQFAAEVRRVRPPEPYKGKGIRYAEEQVRRKVGKAAGAGGTA
jgi:large subunit ribosomal protein L6